MSQRLSHLEANVDQEQALKILLSGKSVLLTGKAGSGKTHVLNQFIKQARKDGKKIAITATTGIAATHLGGQTIHRWSKIGIAETLRPDFFKKLRKADRKRMIETDILIIDEISMLHAYQFDLINRILQTVRSDSKSFGGIQVVMSGDFFQLPPIKRAQDFQANMFEDSSRAGFVTDSVSYAELDPVICYLETQYRQEEGDLTQILDAIRSGIVDQYEIDKLQARMNIQPPADQSLTNLHTTNIDVDRINQTNLARIKQPVKSFKMTASGNKYQVEALKKTVLAPEKLDLKIGAYVMLVKNDPKNRFVNGSLGQIIDFAAIDGVLMPEVKLNTGKRLVVEPATWELMDGEVRLAAVTQFPLRLAYAVTIHKSQGMTLDGAVINLAKAFTPGMGYVALSRVRDLDSLYLTGLNQMALTVSEEAIELDGQLKKQSRKCGRK